MSRLPAIDANLLVALRALLSERSVTRAARSLGLGQPALSHALPRLRALLGDPLLVPAGRALALTERGLALVKPVALACRQLEQIFAPPQGSKESRGWIPQLLASLLLPYCFLIDPLVCAKALYFWCFFFFCTRRSPCMNL